MRVAYKFIYGEIRQVEQGIKQDLYIFGNGINMMFTWKFVSDFIAIFMPIYFLNKIMPTQKKKVYMYYILIIGVLYPVMLLIKDGYYLDIYFKYFIFIITLIYPIVFREGS